MTSISKTDLIEKITEMTEGATKREVTVIVNTILDVVTETVAKGGKVAITGFGSFEAVKRAARTGVNPAKGTKMEIPARTVPRFKAGKTFKDAVNN